MSTAIHQILVKNSTKPVRFSWPFTFGPIDRCAAILASLSHFPFHFKLKAAQCYAACLADDLNPQPQFAEIASSFEIINNRIYTVAGRMFKPDW